MSGHSPGPWRVVRSGIISDTCLVVGDDTIRPEDSHLISAAPDMLAALVRLMEQPTMNPLAMTVDQRKELWAAHEQARDAIAKAEGREAAAS